jgi:hypothetical protein
VTDVPLFTTALTALGAGARTSADTSAEFPDVPPALLAAIVK